MTNYGKATEEKIAEVLRACERVNHRTVRRSGDREVIHRVDCCATLHERTTDGAGNSVSPIVLL